MTGILLVHGAWHGPWCWENFVTHLSERGHEVRAVRLRGHDRPPAWIWHRVRHYVEDLRRAVAEFAKPPSLSVIPWAGWWCRNIWSTIPLRVRCSWLRRHLEGRSGR